MATQDVSLVEAGTVSPSSLQPRKHPALFFLLLVILELAVLFVIAELAATLFLPAGHHYRHPQPLVEPHARRMYDYRPNQTAFTIDQPFVTNTLGFRDERELPVVPDGEVRILALGDSITAGVGVAAEHTYVRQLESLLNGREMPVRVINAGVAGYGVWQELDRLNEKRGLVNPHIIMLQVYWNDLYPKPATVSAITTGGSGDPNQTVQQYLRIFKRSRVLLFLRERWASLSNTLSPSVDWAHRDKIMRGVSDPYLDNAYHELEQNFRELAAERREAVPVVLIVPMPTQVQQPDVPARHMQERIEAMAERAGLPTLDLLPALRRAYSERPDLYIPWDNEHFTPRGHQVVAEALQRYLHQQRLVPLQRRD